MFNYIVVGLTSFFVIYQSYSNIEPDQTLELNFVSFNYKVNYFYTGYPFLILSNIGVMMCTKECVDRTLCKAFEYYRLTTTCKLFDHTNVELGISAGRIFAIKGESTENLFGKKSGECGSAICPDGQICVLANNGNYTCVISECAGPPTLPINRTRFISPRQVGGTQMIICEYRPVGSPFTTCKADGSWTPLNGFICYTICTPAVSPHSIYIINTTDVNMYSVTIFTCNPNYFVVGRLTRTCTSRAYWGQLEGACAYARSCSHGLANGLRVYPTLVIDPDGLPADNAFIADCVETSTGVKTVINVINGTYTEIKGSEDSNTVIETEILYEKSVKIMKSLIVASRVCRQYVGYDCLNAPIHDKRNKIITGFVNATDGTIMNVFAGGDLGSGGCACNKTNEGCAGGHVCNCDMRDESWRADKGYINDLAALPLTKFITDNTIGKEARLTVGNLECEG